MPSEAMSRLPGGVASWESRTMCQTHVTDRGTSGSVTGDASVVDGHKCGALRSALRGNRQRRRLTQVEATGGDWLGQVLRHGDEGRGL